ncbi:MAG: YaaA family protein [Rhodoglobus sp.]
MLLLLPPSETKRDGGADDRRLDLAALGFPQLNPARRTVLAALARLSRNVGESMASLGLGPTQRAEVDRNRALRTSPVLAAIDRYTGVLYDGLDAATFTAADRAFAADHVAIHSALFGLLRAVDPIPAYRLSHDSRLPGLSLRTQWRAPISAELAGQDRMVLDLRSESYAALGPLPGGAWYVRVVTETDAAAGTKASTRAGTPATPRPRVALSHFNKKAKGEFVREVVRSGIDHDTVDSLLSWASDRGIRIERGAPGELDLVL